jgi:hypothetical protein
VDPPLPLISTLLVVLKPRFIIVSLFCFDSRCHHPWQHLVDYRQGPPPLASVAALLGRLTSLSRLVLDRVKKWKKELLTFIGLFFATLPLSLLATNRQ